MNNYFISTNDSSLGYDTTHYWNRRKQRFQSYLSTACIYPTLTGVRRVCNNMDIDKLGNIGFSSLSTFEYALVKDSLYV